MVFAGQAPTHECVTCGKQVVYQPDTRCQSCTSEMYRGWRLLATYLGRWAQFEERFGPN